MDSSLRVLFVEHLHLDRWRTRRRAQLEIDLQAAIAQCQIDLHFQPQYDLRTGRGAGVEALARWSRYNGEQIPPATFIPVAEHLGLIGALGSSVLARACSTLCEWRDGGATPPTLSVNVSALQMNEAFCAEVSRILRDTGFPAERLELEITESALIDDVELALQCVREWKSLGIHIAVDDFGTGYCGLSYLSRLPVDRLKLDKSFVQRMPFERKTAAIVRSVFALGKELDISVLAEGIETERECEMLETLGCRQVQGDLMAKAGPSQEAHSLLMKPWGRRRDRGLNAA
jgi:EAL domain-containing protein (putative c-di-GMP-specific phosphodiesterase class I)